MSGFVSTLLAHHDELDADCAAVRCSSASRSRPARLSGLIDELLMLSKLEAGVVAATRSRSASSRCSNRCVESQRDPRPSPSSALPSSASRPTTTCSCARSGSSSKTLLKYAGATELRGSRGSIEVVDHGPGIRADAEVKVFERFTRDTDQDDGAGHGCRPSDGADAARRGRCRPRARGHGRRRRAHGRQVLGLRHGSARMLARLRPTQADERLSCSAWRLRSVSAARCPPEASAPVAASPPSRPPRPRAKCQPWPCWQPSATSAARWSAASTPSAMAWSPSESASRRIACTSAVSSSLRPSPEVNERSIFSTSTGSCCR